jgi:hypothetical protein
LSVGERRVITGDRAVIVDEVAREARVIRGQRPVDRPVRAR